MKCPNDAATLVMSERSGVEIDYCPECRGVWLDRGELDKIIERQATMANQMPAPAPGPEYRGYEGRPRGYDDDDDDYRRHGGYDQGGYYGKRKRRGWLGDIFDFD